MKSFRLLCLTLLTLLLLEGVSCKMSAKCTARQKHKAVKVKR